MERGYSNSKHKKSVILKCTKCVRRFTNRRHFDRHLEGHERNDCQSCREPFTRRKDLMTHMWDMHGVKLTDYEFVCKYCKHTFTRRTSMYNHYRRHADGKSVCMMCGIFCQDNDELQVHMETHQAERPWSCQLCDQTFARKQQYDVHVKRHNNYFCLTCNESFSNRKYLLMHQRMGHNITGLEKNLKCHLCPKKFNRKTLLRAHQMIHTGEKIFHCISCTKYFQSSKCLVKHLTTESHRLQAVESEVSILEQGFVCEICGKRFKYKQSLIQHRLRNHSLCQDLICEFCGHSTILKSNLKRHLMLHINERQFVCELCGSAFYVLSALKDHTLYMHSDRRDYPCNQCPLAFKRSSELLRHQLIHSDSRPFVCHCSKSFKRSSHLKRHKERVHGEAKTERKLTRLRPDDGGVLRPVPIEFLQEKSFKKTKNAKKQKISPEISQEEPNYIIQSKSIEFIEDCHAESQTMSLGEMEVHDLSITSTSAAPIYHLITYEASSAQPLSSMNSSESRFIITTPSVETISSLTNEEEKASQVSSLDVEPTEDLLINHEHQSCHSKNMESSDMNSQMHLVSHLSNPKGVLGLLGFDVKLSDSMMEDSGDPRPHSPGRESPPFMNELVRLHSDLDIENTLREIRNQDMTREDTNQGLPISSLSPDCMCHGSPHCSF